MRVVDDCVNHVVVAVDHCLKLVFPRLVALEGELRCGEELVGDAAERAHDYDDRLLRGFFLYDSLQAENALYGTNGGSAKLQYFHFVLVLWLMPPYKGGGCVQALMLAGAVRLASVPILYTWEVWARLLGLLLAYWLGLWGGSVPCR